LDAGFGLHYCFYGKRIPDGAHGPLGSKSGVIGGIQAGYNWQINSLVLGIEADFDGLGYKTSASQITAAGALAFGGDTINSRRATWLATVRGRLGFAFDRALIYATGGVAFSALRYGVNDSCITAPCGNGMIDGSARVDTGWTVGVGLEYGITQNWTVKGEYLYAAFDGATFRARDTAAGLFTVPYSATSTNFNIARVGLNYKFGGPVVAKY
jgi:outer membrane immunogenic protein